MSYDEYMRRNKPMRDLRDAMQARYNCNEEQLNSFCALFFEAGQHDQRKEVLEAAFADLENGQSQEGS